MHENDISDVKFPNLYLEQFMMYRKHSQKSSTRSSSQCKKNGKKSCDATLEIPNRSFVAFSDNILTLFIWTFKTPLK